MQTEFAAFEASLSDTMVETFSNLVLTNGVSVVDAVLDRGAEFVGEYGLTGERRDRITIKKADAWWFANGVTIKADPATYTIDELLAMERHTWVLDRVDTDDGMLVSWWLK